MRSWLSVLITDAESKKVFDIPIAPSLYSLSNKMDNSLLAVRVINHKYIVVEKSCTVSVFAIRNFKFLGFALGRNGKGIYVRVHPKSWKKFKSRLKELSSRKRCQSIKPSLEKIKVYARGWLNYYGIASMKKNIDDINGWLYHRIRMCIWKQWKKPRTKVRNLINMGVPKDLAMQAGNTRRGHWFATHTVAVNMAMTKERLINSGFYDLATAYQSVHVNY